MAGDYAIPSEKQLADTLRRMQADIDALKGARDAGFTTLSQGAFTVVDGLGVARAKFGLLSDGTYGIEVLDAGGVPISVGASLFGIVAATSTSFVSLTSSFQNVGPSINPVVGETGKLLVVMSAYLKGRTNAGAATVNPTANLFIDGVVQSMAAAMTVGAGSDIDVAETCADAAVFTLTPGAHALHIEAVANTIPTGTCSITRRTLIAIPL